MKKEIKKMWDGFRRWVKYMREYKDNVDNDFIYDQNMTVANNKIEKLTEIHTDEYKIKDKGFYTVDHHAEVIKENLIKLREEKIKRLTRRIIILKKRAENR